MERQTSHTRLLIIGVGSIGLRHLRCFQATGRVRASICEPNEALRLRVAGEQQVERHYADLDAALADRHDAAIIAAPAHLHVPLALRLAQAGVHLLIEKPLSTTLDGIDTLRQASPTGISWRPWPMSIGPIRFCGRCERRSPRDVLADPSR